MQLVFVTGLRDFKMKLLFVLVIFGAHAGAAGEVRKAPRALTLCAAMVQGLSQSENREGPIVGIPREDGERQRPVIFNQFQDRVDTMVRNLRPASAYTGLTFRNGLRAMFASAVKGRAARLISPVEPTGTYIRDTIKAQTRLYEVAKALSTDPRSVVVISREVRGAENIVDFVDSIAEVESSLSVEVAREMGRRGIVGEQPRPAAPVLAGAILTFPLGTFMTLLTFTGMEAANGNWASAGASAATLGISAPILLKGLARDFTRGLALMMGGRARENAQRSFENEQFYRATYFQDFLVRVREAFASGQVLPADFAYFGDTYPVDQWFKEAMIRTIRGQRPEMTIPLTRNETAHMNSPSSSRGAWDMASLSVDVIVDHDPATREPVMLLIARVEDSMQARSRSSIESIRAAQTTQP